MPTSAAVCGSGSAAASTTNEAKYRPAASLTTVTLDGSDGRRRDHFTGTSPIFGRRSLPPAVIAKRALRVKRIACRLSLRDRKRGGATFGPFRFRTPRSEEHTSELQSRENLVCRLLLEKK